MKRTEGRKNEQRHREEIPRRRSEIEVMARDKKERINDKVES